MTEEIWVFKLTGMKKLWTDVHHVSNGHLWPVAIIMIMYIQTMVKKILMKAPGGSHSEISDYQEGMQDKNWTQFLITLMKQQRRKKEWQNREKIKKGETHSVRTNRFQRGKKWAW